MKNSELSLQQKQYEEFQDADSLTSKQNSSDLSPVVVRTFDYRENENNIAELNLRID